MKEVKGRYRCDIDLRYFREDFTYALCIIKGFAEILKIETPYIDIILKSFEIYL